MNKKEIIQEFNETILKEKLNAISKISLERQLNKNEIILYKELFEQLTGSTNIKYVGNQRGTQK